MLRSGPLRPFPLLALAVGWLLWGCGDDSTGTEPRCGDGTLDPGEQCDDGTADQRPVNGPCSALCTWRQYEADSSAANASRPHVAMNDRGDYALTWQAEGDGLDVWLAAWDATGQPLIPATRVNDTTAGDQHQPRVAIAGDGRLAVVWTTADGNVVLRPWAADGTAGDIVQLNTWTDGAQSEPAVAVNEAGELVACWTSDGQDGDLAGVYAQRGDVEGLLAAGEPFQVNTEWEKSQVNPRLDLAEDGRFAISWKGESAEPG